MTVPYNISFYVQNISFGYKAEGLYHVLQCLVIIFFENLSVHVICETFIFTFEIREILELQLTILYFYPRKLFLLSSQF